MFKFEKVKRFADVEIEAPIRKTHSSACYDMVAAEDVIVLPMNRMLGDLSNIVTTKKITPDIKILLENMIKEERFEAAQGVLDSSLSHTLSETAALTKETGVKPTLVPLGYKAKMPDDYCLELYCRSSFPLKHWLIMPNSVGIIDADYADNEDNDGEISMMLVNLAPFPIKIAKGEVICQAKFNKYHVTDTDSEDEKKERVSGFGSTTIEGEVDIVN
ncbi:hypothetical protein [Clostridium sp.]|uniref:hypothetical protein n=1 Tax=Clostridium sp. TaxID=1506 RepID=UPI002FC7BC09